MKIDITTLEEFDIERDLKFPHLKYAKISLNTKVEVSLSVLARENESLLLISPSGFSDSGVFSGLNENHIEYFAKHAPIEYKKELMKIFVDRQTVDDVLEIAKSIDNDKGGGSTRNQDRIKKVIQYIQDNKVVFQF